MTKSEAERELTDDRIRFAKGESIKLMVRDEQSAILCEPVADNGYQTNYVLMPMRV